MSDFVRLDFIDGRRALLPWLATLDPRDKQKCSLIVVDRMPMTFDENAWFWFALPGMLAPTASIKMGKV